MMTKCVIISIPCDVYVPLWNCVTMSVIPSIMRYNHLPQDIVHRSCMRIRWRVNSQDCSDSPVWQFAPSLGILGDSVEEVLDRVTHIDRWQFARMVGGRTNTPELNASDIKRPVLGNCATSMLTFSSIFASGPPPPSPFPNTSSEMSEDSRFLRHSRQE